MTWSTYWSMASMLCDIGVVFMCFCSYSYFWLPELQYLNIICLNLFNLRILWLNELYCNSSLHRAKSKSYRIIVFLWVSENTHTAIL